MALLRKKYSRKRWLEILRRMEAGEPVTHILQSDPDMPDYATFLRWSEKPGHEEELRRARERQVNLWIDRAVERAIAPPGEVPLPDYLQGATEAEKARFRKAAFNAEMQRRRLEVDTMKWLATKLAPRLYGDKTRLELEGELSVETVTFSDRKD